MGPFEPDEYQYTSFPLSSSECEVLHGECIQTYVPYLFLVIPLGPVTLTGQVGNKETSKPKHYILPLFRTMFSLSPDARVDQSMRRLALIRTPRILFLTLAEFLVLS